MDSQKLKVGDRLKLCPIDMDGSVCTIFGLSEVQNELAGLLG